LYFGNVSNLTRRVYRCFCPSSIALDSWPVGPTKRYH